MARNTNQSDFARKAAELVDKQQAAMNDLVAVLEEELELKRRSETIRDKIDEKVQACLDADWTKDQLKSIGVTVRPRRSAGRTAAKTDDKPASSTDDQQPASEHNPDQHG